jgi:hypothetical protein
VACRSTIGSLSVNSLPVPFRRRMRQPATHCGPSVFFTTDGQPRIKRMPHVKFVMSVSVSC